MHVRYFIFLSLWMISFILIGCNKDSGIEKDEFIDKKLPIFIIEEGSKEKNYILYITSEGLEKKKEAMLPLLTYFIAKNGKSEFKFTVGATYQIAVYPTNLESNEELHKEPKKEPSNPSEKGDKPLLVYEFTAREDMTEIELKIPVNK